MTKQLRRSLQNPKQLRRSLQNPKQLSRSQSTVHTNTTHQLKTHPTYHNIQGGRSRLYLRMKSVVWDLNREV
jgi:hypothetical protein